jgi:Uma2 family endonuclease
MSAAMSDWIRRHRISVDEYYRMAELGILQPDARVELIEGEIIDMAPIGTGHGGTVTQLGQRLSQAAGDLACVSTQQVVRLSISASHSRTLHAPCQSSSFSMKLYSNSLSV